MCNVKDLEFRKEKFDERYNELRSQRIGAIKNTGLTIRDGKVRQWDWNLYEKLMQSKTLDFMRAGGIGFFVYKLKNLLTRNNK